MNDNKLSQGLMDELAAAENSLKRLRIGGSILVVFLLVYLQFLYVNFASMAEPRTEFLYSDG
jgi:hypothetical protein